MSQSPTLGLNTIVTYLSVLLPFERETQRDLLYSSFQYPLNLESWSPRGLFMHSDVYIKGMFLLEVDP